MTLEDRIRNTGEHLLGSLQHAPDLDRRIHERVEHRAHQRRQRAAVGLGAGVVVVLGGLVVLNVDRDGTSIGVAAAPTSPSINSIIADTTPVTAPTTTLPVMLPTAASSDRPAEPASTPPPTVASTIVAPLGDGAPTLFTSIADGTAQWGVDLATGLPVAVGPDAGTDDHASAAPTSGATFGLARSEPSGQGPCSQDPVVALDASGQPVAGFPQWAKKLEISRDGSTGLVRYASCPDAATSEGDAGSTPPVEQWQLAWFRTGDPAAVLTSLDGAWGEMSDDGRYILLEDDSGAPSGIVDTGSPAVFPLLPDGCTSPREDPDAGFLVGTDSSVALAWCDGLASLVGGPIGSPSIIRSLDACGRNSSLSVLDPTMGAVDQNWFAITDNDLKQAWVIGAAAMTDAIPVGDQVSWHPLGTASAD